MAAYYAKTGDNENFGGLSRIYVDFYRDMLWDVFLAVVSLPDLITEIKRILSNARSFKPFHHQFNRLLDVYGSTGTIKNTDCDISVIYSLFRNIPTTLIPPTRGWGKLPQPGDVLVTDDLERIHHGRNELVGHAGTASITDVDFENHLMVIRDIVDRIDQHLGSSYRSKLKRIESDCVSSRGHIDHYESYIKELERQRDFEASLKKNVGRMKRKVEAHERGLNVHDARIGNLESEKERQQQTLVEVQKELGVLRQEKGGKEEGATSGEAALRESIVTKYTREISKIRPLHYCQAVDVLQLVAPLRIREDLERWITQSCEERQRQGRPNRDGIGKEIESYVEIFVKNDVQQREIFLLGEAGVGKTTFCIQLVNAWCRLQNSDPQDNYEKILNTFEFLFFVQARESAQPQSLLEMIKSQVCPLKFHSVLEAIFTDKPEMCLVVLDGLDEWQWTGHHGLPDATSIRHSTILTTSRPWRIEALESGLVASCHVLEIQGLTEENVRALANRVVTAAGVKNPLTEVENFMSDIESKKLNELIENPLLLCIMIGTWLSGNKTIENSRCLIYAGMYKSLLRHSEQKMERKGSKSARDQSLPQCLLGQDSCERYGALLIKLADFAFNTLLSEEKERSLVFSKLELSSLIGEEELQSCLQLGLLSEASFASDSDLLHVTVSFPHKSFQEYLCAVHLNGEGFEVGLERFRARVTSPGEVFDYKNVVLFLSGMHIEHSKSLFDAMCHVVFYRRYAHPRLCPVDGDVYNKMDQIHELTHLCTSEAAQSLHEEVPTAEAEFVVPDIVLGRNTPGKEIDQFCNQKTRVKSFVYKCGTFLGTTTTPFPVVESVGTMHNIQRIGFRIPKESAERCIVCVSQYLSNLTQLESFSFNVAGQKLVRLPTEVSRGLVNELGKLPNLVSVYLEDVDLSEDVDLCDIDSYHFCSQLSSLGFECAALSSAFVSHFSNMLETLYMDEVDLSLPAVDQLCDFLTRSSALKSLTLKLPGTLCKKPFDLTSHTSLCRLTLDGIEFSSDVRIAPGTHWIEIHMPHVYMSEAGWHAFICSLPTVTSQQLNVWLPAAESLTDETMRYVQNEFRVTEDRTEGKTKRYVAFHTNYLPFGLSKHKLN